MSGTTRRREVWARLLQPRALAGHPAGTAFAVLCIALLAIITAADVAAGPVSLGALEIVPLVAAAWLLGDGPLVVIAGAAVIGRLVAAAAGGVDPLTATVQVSVIPFMTVVGRTAAVAVRTAREQAAREALVSAVAALASSSGTLQEILDRILSAVAMEGIRGGTIALIDERDRLYIAAAAGDVDSEVMALRLPLGEGVMGRVASEGTPVLIGDLRAVDSVAAPTRDVGRNALIRSMAAVPLLAAGRTIGVLEVDSVEADRFDDADVTLLEHIALAVAGTVQRAGALQLADEQLKRRFRELSVLLDASRRMASSLDQSVLLEIICASGAEIALASPAGERRGSVVRVREGEAIIVADYDETGATLVGTAFSLDDHPGVAAAYRQAAAVISGTDELRGVLRLRVERTELRSSAHAPIRVGTELWGILSVSTRDRHDFGPEDLRLLQGLADLAGLAIANSELLRVERTRSSELQEHSERMAALDHAKSEFLRLASHELRGPLAVLRGYISMLADGSLGEMPPAAVRVMPILTSKVGEINFLIDQMLETARLEDSRLQLSMAPCDLRTIVQGAIETLRPVIGGRHQLEVQLPEQAVTAFVDQARVTTIVVNLIDNAVKYSPAGGPVSVRLSVAEAAALIAVEDRGLGIAADDVRRLFQRFGRLVTSDNSHIAGTGLGLYLARELARMHQGDITVTSTPGRGSTFALSLPLEPPGSRAASA